MPLTKRKGKTRATPRPRSSTPPRELDTSTLHSSLAPSGPEPRHCSATIISSATDSGMHEEGGGGRNSDKPTAMTPASPADDDDFDDPEAMIAYMRTQLDTANALIKFLHEHVDGMREDRDRYKDRVEELKTLARLTLDMLESAHRREWEVWRAARHVQDERDRVMAAEEEEKDVQARVRGRRRDSLVRKIGLIGKGLRDGRLRRGKKNSGNSGSGGDEAGTEGISPTTLEGPGGLGAVGGQSFGSSRPQTAHPTIHPQVQHPSSSSSGRRAKGHVKSRSESHVQFRPRSSGLFLSSSRKHDDGLRKIPGDELERLVQATDRSVAALREDISKLVDEVNTHKPFVTTLADVPPRFIPASSQEQCELN